MGGSRDYVIIGIVMMGGDAAEMQDNDGRQREAEILG